MGEKVKFLRRVTQITIHPAGSPIFRDMSTHISITDEGGGEFITITQPNPPGEGGIQFDLDEWEEIVAAMDDLIHEIKRNGGGHES